MAENLSTETASETTTAVAAEPIKPTEAAVVTEAVLQAPPEGSENLDKPGTKVEETGVAEESEATDTEETAQYLELDGAEHDLNDVRTWRDGHMMQSDYTKKTTKLSEERKTFKAQSESERATLVKAQSEVTEMKDLLSVLVAEDEAVDWIELKDNDPDKYIELKEKADERKAALEKVKIERASVYDDPVHVQTEQRKLVAANPDWLDKDGKITEKCEEEWALLNNYAARAGFSKEEFSKMTFAHHQNTLLKAAKWDQLQEKGRKIKATRDIVPVVTKPKEKKVNDQPTTVTAAQAFFPNMK